MSPDREDNGRTGMVEKDNLNDNTERKRPIDYEEIADRVYRLMKADLMLERERAVKPGGNRWPRQE